MSEEGLALSRLYNLYSRLEANPSSRFVRSNQGMVILHFIGILVERIFMRCPKFHNMLAIGLLSAIVLLASSCYSYRVATHAQPSTGATPMNKVRTYSLFWGLLNKPQVIHTPVCDSLGVNGVAEVTVRNNFGNALLTVCTLGIYCPLSLEWRCATPCQPSTDPL